MITLRAKPVAPLKALYVPIGQSNEQGHGALSQVPNFPRAYRVSIYGYDEKWRAGAEPVHDHAGITSANMVFNDDDNLASSGMAFANEMATNGLIGLIPCAKGGSSVAHWQKGGDLYTAMTNRINAALQEEGTYLAGFLEHQGEEDTRTTAKANAFKALKIQFYTDLQNDFGKPIVFCQLGPNPNLPERPKWDFVKSEQASISMDGVEMVTTDDLETNPDKVHLNTPSLVIKGIRQATAMKGLMN